MYLIHYCWYLYLPQVIYNAGRIDMLPQIHVGINPNQPNPPRGALFGKKNQHCWKLVHVISPVQMGQNYYLARSTGHKC